MSTKAGQRAPREGGVRTLTTAELSARARHGAVIIAVRDCAVQASGAAEPLAVDNEALVAAPQSLVSYVSGGLQSICNPRAKTAIAACMGSSSDVRYRTNVSMLTSTAVPAMVTTAKPAGGIGSLTAA